MSGNAERYSTDWIRTASTPQLARFLFQCWLRWPPGRHDFVTDGRDRICSRCGVLRAGRL